jgi:hypothetical protein
MRNGMSVKDSTGLSEEEIQLVINTGDYKTAKHLLNRQLGFIKVWKKICEDKRLVNPAKETIEVKDAF